MVRFVDHDHLEPLLSRLVDLLGLGDLLQEVLDHDPVVVADIGRRDLEVVNGRDNVELELAVVAGLEDARVDLYFFNTGPEELFERSDDTGFLAGARGPVNENVGEVATLRLLLLEELSFLE